MSDFLSKNNGKISVIAFAVAFALIYRKNRNFISPNFSAMNVQIKTILGLFSFSTLLWFYGVLSKNVTHVDSWWSMGFLYSSFCALPRNPNLRSQFVFAATLLWSLRLSLYLTWRNHGLSEDPRYAAIRKSFGNAFWWKSYYVVFLLQAALCYVISQPIIAAEQSQVADQRQTTNYAVARSSTASKHKKHHLTWLDYLGVAFWSIGFIFESVGDFQLAKFKQNPSNASKIITTGLWKYTRHPNYFGNAMMHWGFFLFSLNSNSGWKHIYAPMIMTYLLTRVSGVSLLERSLVKTKPGFEEYMKNTSSFVPWFPAK